MRSQATVREGMVAVKEEAPRSFEGPGVKLRYTLRWYAVTRVAQHGGVVSMGVYRPASNCARAL